MKVALVILKRPVSCMTFYLYVSDDFAVVALPDLIGEHKHNTNFSSLAHFSIVELKGTNTHLCPPYSSG